MFALLRKYRRQLSVIATALVLGGCAGMQRSCTSWSAQQFGSDWIVVQYRFDGTAFNCWKLKNTSVQNEEKSDGIYWLDAELGHLVHISGWYNRVQVNKSNYQEAATLLGIELNRCGSGKYTS